MKINFRQPFVNLDGSPLLTADGKAPDLISTKVLDALLMPPTTQLDNVGGQDKITRYQLAQKIYSATAEVDITVEEAALIKQLIGRFFGPLVVAQTWALIDGVKT